MSKKKKRKAMHLTSHSRLMSMEVGESAVSILMTPTQSQQVIVFITRVQVRSVKMWALGDSVSSQQGSKTDTVRNAKGTLTRNHHLCS